MKKNIKLVILAMIVIVFAGVYSIVDINNAIYDSKIDNGDYNARILNKGDNLVQTFVAGEDNLDGVEVKIAVSDNKETAEIGYQLQDDSGKILAKGETTLDNLKNGKFFEFRFDRLSGCKGKTYTFQMELEHCDADTDVSVYEVPSLLEGTSYTYNQEKQENTMALRVITHRFNIETFVVTMFFAVYVIVFMKWLAKLFKG